MQGQVGGGICSSQIHKCPVLVLVPASLLIAESVMSAFLSADWFIQKFFSLHFCLLGVVSGDSSIFFSALDACEQIYSVLSSAPPFTTTNVWKLFQNLSSWKRIYKHSKNWIFSGTSLEAEMLWFKIQNNTLVSFVTSQRIA